MKKVLVIGTFIVLTGTIGYFLANRPKTAPLPTPTPSAVTPKLATPSLPGSGTQVKEILITGKEYSFSPSSLVVSKGEKIRLTFKNAGKMTHDLVIEELDIRTRMIEPGQEDVLEFTPQEGGDLTYFCNIGLHRLLGMEGVITVQ